MANAQPLPDAHLWISDFNVRVFGGCGLGPFTRDHLDRAKRTLEGCFSVALVADDPASYVATAGQLASKLGWKEFDVNKHRAGTLENSSFSAAYPAGHPVVERLAAMNALDAELHAFAREVAGRRMWEELCAKPQVG